MTSLGRVGLSHYSLDKTYIGPEVNLMRWSLDACITTVCKVAEEQLNFEDLLGAKVKFELEVCEPEVVPGVRVVQYKKEG